MHSKIEIINKVVNKELWFDFEVRSFDGYHLTVVGGTDLYYGCIIEITFIDVSFCLIKNEWKKKDDFKAVDIVQSEKQFEINKLYRIEIGYHLFQFNHEDMSTNQSDAYIIAAKTSASRLIKNKNNLFSSF